MIVRSLTVHMRYACRHRGACCTSGWPIPVEREPLAALEAAVRRGQLAGRWSQHPWSLRPADAPEATPAVLTFDEGGCVFYDTREGGRCRIHRAIGHHALPLACRQFPRVSVIDPRGASVTLSHYCPTAAALLETDAPVAITDAPPAFPAGSEVVGLDVRAGLPPLLAPGMLMDWDAWWEWERRAIETIACADGPREALATLSGAVESIRRWTPRDGPLVERLHDAFERGRPGAHAPAGVLEEVLASIPDDLRPGRLEPADMPSPTAARVFLAAHAFASWTAHLGRGLRSWLRSLQAAHEIAGTYGVRQADLLIRHLADPGELARRWSRWE